MGLAATWSIKNECVTANRLQNLPALAAITYNAASILQTRKENKY